MFARVQRRRGEQIVLGTHSPDLSPRCLTPLQQVGIWVWIAFSVGLICARGRALGLDRHVSARLQLNALPVAISVLYHGHPHDYTALASIAKTMRSGGGISAAVSQVVPPGDGTFYWAADDRGMADYVIAAFALFGPRVESLYWMYFVVLSASIGLLLADLARHAAGAAVAIMATAALYVCLPVIPLGNLTLPIFETGSLFEPRILELLSYVASSHLGMTAWLAGPWTPARRTLIAAQALILVLCYHARSSIGWQVVFVMISVAARLVADFRRAPAKRTWPQLAVRAGWPAVTVVAALVVLTAYHRTVFNPRYFVDKGDRTVWHNALMGLSWSDRLVREYHLQVNDGAIVEAVRKYYINSEPRVVPYRWYDTDPLGTLGGQGETNLFDYERVARAFYLHIWRTEPAAAIRCYAIAKPAEIGHIFARATRPQPGAVSGPAASIEDLGFNPFSPIALTLVFPAFLLACARPTGWTIVCVLVVMLLCFSLVPGIMFYPVVHTMMGAFATLTVLCYSLITAAIARVCQILFAP
jgi:hypothetical protein